MNLMMNDQYTRRIARVRSKLSELQVDAILVTDDRNVRYLTGFTGGQQLRADQRHRRDSAE